MRIDRITCGTANGRTRLSARLVWEDSERDDDTLWYEWPSSFSGDVSPAPAAVLVPALPLAMVNGERRVAMEEPVCAFLSDHLRNVIGLFGAWYPHLTPPALDIASETASPAPVPNDIRRAAVCLSGGVDSLAALVENHGALAPGHPERMRDGMYLFGLNTYDFEKGVPVDARVAWYQEYGRRLEGFGAHVGVQLVPVATNVRSLYSDWAAWSDVGQSSVLSAAAHAMPRRVHALTIAAGESSAAVSRSGTQPSLDPLYSSYSLDVRSVQATLSRIEKLRMIARYPDALAVLRVCLTFDVPPPSGGTINCGRCEKCLRTMLALIVCDALERTPTFPVGDVVPDMLAGLQIDMTAGGPVELYRAIVDPLRQRGRGDLAHGLEMRMADLERGERAQPKSLVQRLFRG